MQTLGLSNKKAWLIFLVASLFPFYGFIEMNMLNTLGPYLISKNYSLSALSASYFYTDAVLLLPAGLLLDRYDTKTVMLSGLVLSCFGAILFASASESILLILARAISGAGHAFALLSCFHLINLCFRANKQAFMVGLVITIALCGGMLAQAPMSFLIIKIGPRPTLWCNAAFGFLVLSLLFLALPYRLFKKASVEKVNFWHSICAVIKFPQNWLCGFFADCVGLPLSLLGATWGVTYFTAQKSLSAIEVSWLMSGLFLGVIVGSPIAGWLSDKCQRRRLPMIFGAVFSVVLVFFVLFLPLSYSTMFFAIFFLSLISAVQILAYPVVAESNLKIHSSAAMGFMNVLVMFLAASYQLIFGFAWSHSVFPHIAEVIVIAIMFLGIIVALCVREPLG